MARQVAAVQQVVTVQRVAAVAVARQVAVVAVAQQVAVVAVAQQVAVVAVAQQVAAQQVVAVRVGRLEQKCFLLTQSLLLIEWACLFLVGHKMP